MRFRRPWAPLSLVYAWKATYTDGSVCQQFDSDGKEHLFNEVDQSRLKKFGWFPLLPSLPSYEIDIQPGEGLIAYRSVEIKFGLGRSSRRPHRITYVLGIAGKRKIEIDEYGWCHEI